MLKLRAFQDLTGVKLEGDIEIYDAPNGSERDHEGFRFLFWVDDHILGRGKPPPIRSITVVHTDGRREPMTGFCCNPAPEHGL